MKYGILALVLALTACSSDPSKSTASARPQTDDPSKGIICKEEIPTGSALRKKVCTTPEEREAQRRAAEALDVQRSRGDAR